MSTTRRDLRAGLTRLGERPVDGPSLAFRNRLERQLTGAADTSVGATLLREPLRMSTTRRDLRADLTRLGERPVDGPSLAFRNRLERQLTGTADTDGGAALVPLPRRHRRLVPLASVAAAIIAAVVLTGALLGAFGNGGSGLQLGHAHDTTVRLPDGRVVSGRTGLGLPNGSVVRTGPNGGAAAGSVELGPSLQGVVDNNRLVLQSAPTLPAVTPPLVITVPKIPPATLPALPAPTLPPIGLGH